ncbi:MAG: alanine--tRNA ligase [Candidatus Omnitrophota bacterium]
MQAQILRKKFLDFFKSKKHKLPEPDSLVPKEDATVLFTPAGMNQFKKEFLGFDSGFTRVATCQRCLRTDDLDKVGKTSGHHTFFEMLGNFSFGDYFKEDAISYAWEFLTDVLKVHKERLWISVYKEDSEAYKIWKDSVGVPDTRIIKLGDKENFWPSEAKSKGPNGPCGPCSEIFFDQGKKVGCRKAACNPNCDCDRFIEVWNLVFTQFNRKEGGKIEPLPKKNIDTGMGLERLAAVMQGVLSNFETDLFKPIVKEIASECQSVKVSKNLGLVYAVADHLRAVTFSIFDGVLPSNEARGYVIRKLIRKSVLHLKELGVAAPFLYKLVPVLSEGMLSFYPGLSARRENIAEIILSEENSFIATLNSSEALFIEKFRVSSGRKLGAEETGRIAFQLYDTHGVPWELTNNWAKKHGLKISEVIYKQELEKQKERSKLQTSMKGDVFIQGAFDFKVKATKFSGYEDVSTEAKILKIIKDKSQVNQIGKGESGIILLDKSVFYPESGGQVGDSGEIFKGKNIFEVKDTQIADKVILHLGEVKEGNFKVGQSVNAKIDLERRLSIARNHTATHLLQAALRKVLGSHVQQQGSLVAHDRLRFDFTHFKEIDDTLINRIEEVVNGYILNNHGLEKKQMELKAAKKSGALAFFGEKYEEKVRVVSIGDFSKELCGGIHLCNTGEIGLFKIVQEGSVASGIRRIEATTGSYAYNLIKKDEQLIKEVSQILKVNKESIPEILRNNLGRLKVLEKSIQTQKMESLKESIDSWIDQAEVINGIKIITKVIDNLDMQLLRQTVDSIKAKVKSSVILLGSASGNKALLVMGISKDLCEKGLDAVKLIRNISGIIDGSGGGREDFAQAGGTDPDKFNEAFNQLKELIKGRG